jgi:glycerate kinase
MSAAVVADALADGIEGDGGIAVRCPLADGGEGTLGVLQTALGGHRVAVMATGPLGAPVRAEFVISEDGQTAVIESASASGLHLVAENTRDAEAATSFGTGELLTAAVALGVKHILLGVGGSACTDGGAGALRAIRNGGGLGTVQLTVLCDVQTPFEQAARVFGPQKGADPLAVVRLNDRLAHLAEHLPQDPRGRPRTGAAGGLSGALWAAHHAELVSGIDTILDLVEFERLLGNVDAVITGEGRLDGQTTQGKALEGVTRRASIAGIPVWAVVGQSEIGPQELLNLKLIDVYQAGDPETLYQAGREILRVVANWLNSRGQSVSNTSSRYALGPRKIK